MGKDDSCMCGMHLCGKCAPWQVIFGILFLVAGFGLWGSAPAWFNGWTLIGVYLALWGVSAYVMKK